MRTDVDKYALVAGDFLSSGAPLRLNPELPWPELLEWKEGAWQRRALGGFNVFKLMHLMEENGYRSPFWIALRDGEEAGGVLKEGATGVNVATWRWSGGARDWRGDLSPENVDKIEAEVEGAEGETDLRVAMRPKVLFSAEEWEGIREGDLPAYVARGLPSVEEARERASDVERRGAGCEVRHEGVAALYNAEENCIVLPPKGFFKSERAYYWALFEQIGHALASKQQLDLWKGPIEGELANDLQFKALYARMVAAMLAYETGVDVLE